MPISSAAPESLLTTDHVADTLRAALPEHAPSSGGDAVVMTPASLGASSATWLYVGVKVAVLPAISAAHCADQVLQTVAAVAHAAERVRLH